MKKWSRKSAKAFLIILAAAGLVLSGCGGQENETSVPVSDDGEAGAEDIAEEQTSTGLAYETAEDTLVDIGALQEENPDVFGWLYIPGTDIDLPVLQNKAEDDYYESHNAYGETSNEGALYIELANRDNMCDFNTVIHGKCSEDGEEGTFAQLYRFADPDFFKTHENVYLYLDRNLLTYEIFAAYEREDTSLIRTYDFTYMSGCQEFLDDLYGTRQMSMNLREGWEGMTPYHFLITLSATKGENPDNQFVVVAALTGDAAGTIDRLVYE